LLSCNKSQDKQPNETEIYKNDEIGWEMRLPNGWKKKSDDKINQLVNRGATKIEESLQVKIEDIDKTKHLLCLEKGLNQFITNITKQTKDEYQESISLMNDILNQTYTNNGLQVNMIENPDINIDGINFKHSTYQLSSNGIKFEQNFYMTYHNGYLFNVSLTTYTEEAKKEIEDVFKNSKFKK